MKRKLFVLLISGMFLTGCGQDKATEQTTPPQKTSQETTSPAAPQGTPETAQPTSMPNWSFTGKVVETIDAGGYTYVLADNGTEQKWVAIMKTDLAKGEEVTFADGLLMRNFESKSLNRTFDEIVFSSGAVGKTPQPPAPAALAPKMTTPPGGTSAETFEKAVQSEGGSAPMAGMPGGMGSGKPVVPFENIKVERATGENAATVGELYDKSADYNGKKILLRGKVVKVSKNIMGKNWIHLQDGTGDAAKNTHDMVATSQDAPNIGDTVTITGTVQTEKDFGSGYKYDIIVEEATITQ